jgi:hypothetical protein
VANACQAFHVPWVSLKLISDDFAESSENEVCRTIRSEWKTWSELIDLHLQAFLKSFLVEKSPLLDFNSDPNFFFTRSMQNQFLHWRNSLAAKINFEDKLLEIKNEILRKNKDLSAKSKSKLLLQELERLSNPDFFQVKRDSKNFLKQYESPQANIKIDETLETNEIKIQINISNATQLEESLKKINHFDFGKFESLLNGQSLGDKL